MKNTSQVAGKHGAALEGRACPLREPRASAGSPRRLSPLTPLGEPPRRGPSGPLAQRAHMGKGAPPAVDPKEPWAPLHSSSPFAKRVLAAFSLASSFLPIGGPVRGRRAVAVPAMNGSKQIIFFLNKTKSGFFLPLSPPVSSLTHTKKKIQQTEINSALNPSRL